MGATHHSLKQGRTGWVVCIYSQYESQPKLEIRNNFDRETNFLPQKISKCFGDIPSYGWILLDCLQGDPVELISKYDFSAWLQGSVGNLTNKKNY